MNKVQVYENSVTIPTYEAGAPEKNPLFIEKRAYQGSTGKVYPLPVTEKISEEKTDHVYRAVFLENEYLLVMILPELGGRIQRALDKTNGYDFVYYNHVIKPALVGLAGPWISGGIEFNWPQHHRPSTFMSVDYCLAENPDGSATVTLGETDRMNGTKGNAAITLYPDKAYIEIRGRLYNPTDFPQSFLWWANPAVPVNDHTFSVFPPDVNAVVDHGKRAVSTFPIATGEYYKADYSAGVDISRYKNIRVPTSYMAAHSDFDFVGNYDERVGAGLLHVADHHVSPGKKQWTWGCGNFGKTWDKNLTDEDGPYIELMTGIYCDNQPDFTWLKPQEEKTFVQYFMPYKAVGRVRQATKDLVLGVDYLDEQGGILEVPPFEFGEEANRAVSARAHTGRVRLYACSLQKNITISVISGKASDPSVPAGEVCRETISLMPGEVCTKLIPGLSDYRVRIFGESGREILSCREYVKENRPVPKPLDAMKAPSDIGSVEELYLAGLHLEQYRHASFLPEDYYLEGLRHDSTDIRLNNAYGRLLLKQGRASDSIPYFKTAIKKETRWNPNPYQGESWFNYGTALLALSGAAERLDQAFDAFYKAAWSAETAGPAYYRLACIAVRQGRLRTALSFTEEAILRQYHNMKARGLKAAILTKLLPEAPGNTALWEQRSAFLTESLAIDPLYFALRYYSDDAKALQRAMGKRPENYLNLAYELLEYGFKNDASDVLGLCPAENPMKYYTLSYACSEDGLFKDEKSIEKAKMYRQKGEEADPAYCFPNRLIEERILECMTGLNTDDKKDAPAMAQYYLGALLYDKRRYREAAERWESCVLRKPDFAPAHRMLSIVYYNHAECFGERDAQGLLPRDLREKLNRRSKDEIAAACRRAPSDSRFLLEQDQLLKRLGMSVKERLCLLEAHPELLRERSALMLACISLLNQDNQHEKALDLLMHNTFHVWEGGEGKVADEYKTALFALSEREAEKARTAVSPEAASAYWQKAFDFAAKTLVYPDHLGEGKLDNVPDNEAYYKMGRAAEALGNREKAAEYFLLASSGSQVPEPVRYYNDQSSEYIYWQGLSFHARGNDEMAKKSFHQLISYGKQHIFDEITYDYFAVSLPELEVYRDDINQQNRDYCRRLMLLGQKGLSEIS